MENFVNNQSFWNDLNNNENAGWDLKSVTPAYKSFIGISIF